MIRGVSDFTRQVSPSSLYNQTFTYDPAGRMRSNSRVGAYAYANPTIARHAPSSVTPQGGAAQVFGYDANGNMALGLDGKVMTYDGENRPLGVAFAGKMTCYIYGADGTRLKKVEGLTPAPACPAAFTAAHSVTAYFGPVEVRNFGKGAAGVVGRCLPRPAVRPMEVADGGGRDAAGLAACRPPAANCVFAWAARWAR